MATIIHTNFRDAQMGEPAGTTTQVDFPSDAIDASLTEAAATGGVDVLVTHTNYGEIDTQVVADRADSTQVPLTTKTVGSVSGLGAGIFNADDITYTTVAAGDAAAYLSLHKYDATPANATLIVTWDSATTGLPVTPNGGDITVTWNVGGIVQI